MLGLAQGAFDKAVPSTYERKQFGQAVGTFQGMAFQIAQAAIDLETARLLVYNVTRRKEEGLSFVKEAAMAKYWTSVVAQRVSGQAIEWAGGLGFTRETGIEKFWRDSKIVSLIYRSEICLRSSNLINLGCYIRRDVQHSITDHLKDYPEGVFIELRLGLPQYHHICILAISLEHYLFVISNLSSDCRT